MIRLKKVLIFNNFFLRNTFPDNSKSKVLIDRNSTSKFFFVSGKITQEVVDQQTGNIIQAKDSEPGLCVYANIGPYGIYNTLSHGNTVVYCYDPKNNQGRQLNYDTLIMQPGETRLFENETKMYLCKGELVIDNVTYNENTEIVCPPNVTIKSNEESSIIIVP